MLDLTQVWHLHWCCNQIIMSISSSPFLKPSYFTIAIPYPRYYTMNHLQWECRETPLASQLLAALLLYPSKSLFSWSPSYPQDESVYRCLVCLGNTLHASNSQEEVTTCFFELHILDEMLYIQVRQLLQSMDANDLVSGFKSRGGKVSVAASEILQMLKSGDGIDLDWNRTYQHRYWIVLYRCKGRSLGRQHSKQLPAKKLWKK